MNFKKPLLNQASLALVSLLAFATPIEICAMEAPNGESIQDIIQPSHRVAPISEENTENGAQTTRINVLEDLLQKLQMRVDQQECDKVRYQQQQQQINEQFSQEISRLQQQLVQQQELTLPLAQEKAQREEAEARAHAEAETRAAAEEAERARSEEVESTIAQIPVPPVARGYEEVYRRFLSGRLIYRPNEGSDVGKVELPIVALRNPLESPFDLSACGDTEQYLSISTGFRRAKNPANGNRYEIWLAPYFLIKPEVRAAAEHYDFSMRQWNAEVSPVAIFYNWGNDDLGDFWYFTEDSIANLSNNNLYEKWTHTAPIRGWIRPPQTNDVTRPFSAKKFHVRFD